MSEWWSYRLDDLLLFSPRVYWRMFELHNAQLWPLPLVTLASGVVAVVLAMRQTRGAALPAGLMLAILWIFVGWSFLWNRYMPINWAIAYVVPLFVIEAFLLATAAMRGGVAFEKADITGRGGLLIAAFGIAVYPLLAPLFGRPWTGAEVFGIAPDPTAMATLGLMLAARGRMPLLLLPIPAAWLLLSGMTLHTMGDSQGWIALAAAGAAAVLASLRLAPR